MDTSANSTAGNGGARSTQDPRENFNEARKAAMEAYSNLLEAKRKFASAARVAGMDVKEHAHEHLDDALVKARERGSELYSQSENYVRENPMATAGIAFLTGYILSRLMR
jgi:ElaB/YqjD/DUF883 family membrane-anchored ribosome-binding protein